MKKILILILVVLLLISILLNVLFADLLTRIQESKPRENLNAVNGLPEIIEGAFSLRTYQWGIENFPVNEKVEKIEGVEDAARKGLDLWTKYLNINTDDIQYDPVYGDPIKVSYDMKSDCWLIQGTLPPEAAGVVPTAIIQSNGDVIAVWWN